MKSTDPAVQQHYWKLMKKAEAMERDLDSDDEEISRPTKLLPNFKKLKEDTEQFQLKVDAFFKDLLVIKVGSIDFHYDFFPV